MEFVGEDVVEGSSIVVGGVIAVARGDRGGWREEKPRELAGEIVRWGVRKGCAPVAANSSKADVVRVDCESLGNSKEDVVWDLRPICLNFLVCHGI